MLTLRSAPQVAHPRDPVIAAWLGGYGNTTSGIAVSPDTAKRFSVVATCVRVLSESVASLPIFVYRRTENDGKRKDPGHALYSILHDQPNSWQTSVEFVEMLVQHMLLRGNFYARIVSRGLNVVDELIPIHPDRVTPFWAPNGSIAYLYVPEKGGEQVLLQHEVLHIRDLTEDGLVGVSRISGSPEAIGLGMAMERFGAAFFGNGASAGMVLEHPLKLSQEAYNRLKESWENRHRGAANAHKPAILEEGLKLSQLGVKPDEAQFIESRKLSKEDIAGIFRVPMHLINALERATNNNIEHQGIDFVNHSLRPILVRIEKAMRRDLLSIKAKSTHFIEFKMDALLRGDFKSRQEGLAIQRNHGVINANEWRALENMNRQEGDQGDTYLVPLNMMPADKIGQDVDDEPGDGANALRLRIARAHRGLLRNAFERIVTCEAKALRNACSAARDAHDLEARVGKFFGGHDVFVRRHLQPVADTLAETLAACGTGQAAARIAESMAPHLEQMVRGHIADLATSVRDTLIADGIEGVRRLSEDWDNERAADLAERALQDMTAQAVEVMNA